MTESEDLDGVALLTEPARRSLYEYVAASERPVGRQEAAAQVGVSKALAAFHLDRLVDGGLLETEYARLSARRGPGAGRPAKLYRRSGRDFDVSVPRRDYALPALLLSEVVATSARSRSAAMSRARSLGVDLGKETLRGTRSRSGPGLRAALRRVLEERGFEPQADGRTGLRLRNCPFAVLSRSHSDLICGMNHALLSGLVEGLGEAGIEAVLEPEPGWCCVRFHW
jgi:predicted ArsR family transcriptional regulator